MLTWFSEGGFSWRRLQLRCLDGWRVEVHHLARSLWRLFVPHIDFLAHNVMGPCQG